MATPSVEISPTQLRKLQAELQSTLAELRSESANADIAELARLLVHDFNNFLNNIILSLAVLEQSGEASSESVAPLRAQAEHASAAIKEFHNYRRKLGAIVQPFSLNDALHNAARRLQSEREQPKSEHNFGSAEPLSNLTMDLDTTLPPVAGVQHDFVRMIYFLLRNSLLIASTHGGQVRVKTSHASGTVELAFEISQATASAGQLESRADAFSGVSSLELAASSSIARRSHAKFALESRAESGLSIRLKMPAASP